MAFNSAKPAQIRLFPSVPLNGKQGKCYTLARFSKISAVGNSEKLRLLGFPQTRVTSGQIVPKCSGVNALLASFVIAPFPCFSARQTGPANGQY
jgi:hypothetical protein